jgi:Xylose isomerase-like TIM barrel
MKVKANDGSRRHPRIEIQQAMWSLAHYGDKGKEWSLEEKFEQIAKAGFTGIFGSLPAPQDEPLWRRLMEEYGFSFGLESFPATTEDLHTLLKRANDFEVLYVNAQIPDAFIVGQEAINRIQGLMEEANRFGVPFFVETHRGRITQDLLRTIEYVNAIPNMRLTMDLSHYVLAGEMYEFEQADPYFDRLLQRTSSIHARVTNAQQIQIDVGPNGEHPMVEHFVNWWKRGMAYWLKEAEVGDVLPFVCEIGHHYTVTPNYLPGFSWEEHYDRWQQSLVFKRLAKDAWNDVLLKTGRMEQI